MENILNVYYLNDYWEEIADSRSNDLPLIRGGLWRILAIMSTYLLITRSILPQFMKSRKAFQLKKLILTYNALMVLANAYIFFRVSLYLDSGRIFFEFKYPTRDDTSPQTFSLIGFIWWFTITRFLDLLDTVFFVLRKKDTNISVLHLYHHTVVPLICWCSLKHNATIPIIRLFIFINSFIHVLMYSYYALASFGPRIRPYLWWKKYITQIQILQFIICGTYGLILYFKQTDYPMDWFVFVVGQNPLFFILFFNFYKKSYRKDIIKDINSNIIKKVI